MNKFKINQDAYLVKDWKITPVKINAIIIRNDKNGETLKYEILYPNNHPDKISEAYLIPTWEEARAVALDNWNKIYKKVLKELETNKGFNFEEAKKIVESMKRKEKNEK